MSDLRTEDIALLSLARDGHEPRPADRARVRSALAASLGASAGLGVARAATVSAASPGRSDVGSAVAQASGLSGITKVLAGVALLVGVVGGGVSIAHRVHNDDPPLAPTNVVRARVVPTIATSAPPHERPVERPGSLSTALAAAPAAPELLARHVGAVEVLARHVEAVGGPSASPSHAAPAQASPRAGGSFAVIHQDPVRAAPLPVPAAHDELAGSDDTAAVPLSSATRVVPAETPTVEAEAHVVRRAVEARQAGESRRALQLLDEYDRAYPRGVLGEESAAERVLALCNLGRIDDARAQAAQLARTRPYSMLNARLRASCAAVPNP